MNFIRRMYTSKMVYPYAKFNEFSSDGFRKSDGCHDSIPEHEKGNVLPRVLNTFLGMYPRYVLHSGE